MILDLSLIHICIAVPGIVVIAVPGVVSVAPGIPGIAVPGIVVIAVPGVVIVVPGGVIVVPGIVIVVPGIAVLGVVIVVPVVLSSMVPLPRVFIALNITSPRGLRRYKICLLYTSRCV